ncbi:type II secretion system protein J [Thaumasiovibrio sp. DFM-14]|uniref:PulJ/GspJ family protein n=1 Tax=Thaumasiovibrio sp. DFM-14 TaxID=3384792 RepID=UPI0039A248DE
MKGFTLLEMVITLMVVAVLSLAVTGMISLAADGYSSGQQREQLQGEARFLLGRLSQEIRHAIPNSLSVDEGCLSFYPAILSGFYLDDRDNPLQVLPLPSERSAWLSPGARDGWQVAVGLGLPSQFSEAPRVVGDIEQLEPDAPLRLTLSEDLTTRSSGQRLYLFDQPVSFCVEGRYLYRGYQGQRAVLGDQIDQLAFHVVGGGLHGSGLVNIDLGLIGRRSGERAQFNHSVQVLNVQ